MRHQQFVTPTHDDPLGTKVWVDDQPYDPDHSCWNGETQENLCSPPVLHYDDITVEIDLGRFASTYVSLNKLIGERKVVDVLGRLGGYGDPVFMASWLLLDDGSTLELQGEHDEVFVFEFSGGVMPDDETMMRLYRENTDNADDDDD